MRCRKKRGHKRFNQKEGEKNRNSRDKLGVLIIVGSYYPFQSFSLSLSVSLSLCLSLFVSFLHTFFKLIPTIYLFSFPQYWFLTLLSPLELSKETIQRKCMLLKKGRKIFRKKNFRRIVCRRIVCRRIVFRPPNTFIDVYIIYNVQFSIYSLKSYRTYNYIFTIITCNHNSRTPGINLWPRRDRQTKRDRHRQTDKIERQEKRKTTYSKPNPYSIFLISNPIVPTLDDFITVLLREK